MNIIMNLAYLIVAIPVIMYCIYETYRKKYEVLCIVIDSKKGATCVNNPYFRTRKEALQYCNRYSNRFFQTYIIEH